MPTVVQLRSELKKLGLNDKGLKAVLEARLAEYEAQRSHAAASSSGATGDQRVDHDGPRTPLEGERGARLQRGWSLVVEAALSSARRPLQDDQSIQERGKKAQTDATYKKAQTDARAVDSRMVEHTAAPAVLWQLWSERVARVLRACVLCVSVYQLTVCSTALVDGSWPRSMLDDVDDVPSLPALVIALLALSRSSVLHAALPDSSRPWASGLRQQRVGVVLGAGVLLLLLPTVPIAVGSPAIIALLVLVRAAVLMHFADRIARLVVGVLVPALGGFVVWCILKGWRFREGGLRINRLEQHGETWRAAVNESADAITLCRQAGDEDLMQSCAEEAVERLGRAEFAVVDNTESLLCWGVLLSVICHEVLAWIGTRISHWKVRQVAAVHWAKLRHSRHTDIFKAAFQSIDRDNDKSISREELRAALIQIGLRPGEAGTEIETAPDTNEMRTRIDKLMSAVDTNQDGTIDYGEFEKMMNMHVQEGDWAELLDLNSERQVQNAFADCNVRTDGTPRADRRTTSRTELQRVMAHVYSSRQTHKTDKEIAKLAHDMIASVKRRRQPSSAACSVSSGSAGDISYREFRSGLLGKTELHPVQQQMLVDWQLEDRVQALRSWSWQLPFLGPALWVPIPLLLPILFGPALLWIARLVSTCRALGLGGTGVGCPFRFFELTIPWPSTLASQVAALVGGWCSDSACVLLQPFAQHAAETLKLLSEGLFFNVGALQLPPAMLTEAGIRIPGVPLTSFASSVMDEFSGEAKSFGLIGAMAAVPAVHEYYIQFRDAERQREEEAEKERKEASRNMMDLVQFSLCMLRRLPADHLDPAKRGKLQFMYTTLFEVKLEDLVKGHLKTARLIGEAAAKCTQKYPFMHSLDPEAWQTVRGMIINELSSRFSLGYLAEELLGSQHVQKSKFLFGLANEAPSQDGRGNKRTSLKLRVIVAQEQLLKIAYKMNHPRGEPPLSQPSAGGDSRTATTYPNGRLERVPFTASGGGQDLSIAIEQPAETDLFELHPELEEVEAEAGAGAAAAAAEEPLYRVDFHRDRWIYTVRNMADLHHDMERWEPQNKPLREIELCMAAPALNANALAEATRSALAQLPPAGGGASGGGSLGGDGGVLAGRLGRGGGLGLAAQRSYSGDPGDSLLVRGQSQVHGGT